MLLGSERVDETSGAWRSEGGGQVIVWSRKVRWGRVKPLVVVENDRAGSAAKGVRNYVAEETGRVAAKGRVGRRRVVVPEQINVRSKVAQGTLAEFLAGCFPKRDHTGHLPARCARAAQDVPALPDSGPARS